MVTLAAIAILTIGGSDPPPDNSAGTPAAGSPTPNEVVDAWYEAYNAGRIKQVTALFGLPLETNAPDGEEHLLTTEAEVFATFSQFGCGAEVLERSGVGDTLTIRQRLQSRPGGSCPERFVGVVERIQFKVRDGRIVSWHFV